MLQQRFTVLIVDDSDADRLNYRRYLQRNAALDCAVLETDSGESGLAICHQACPDVVLLDYRLPDLDGLEFLQALKPQKGQMPAVVVVTGQGSEAIAARILKAGAEDYLIKGQITAASLQHSLEQAMEKSSLRRQLTQSEDRLRLALETAKLGIWEWRSPENQLFCSDQVGPSFGLPAGSPCLSYSAVLKRVYPQDRPIIRNALRRAFGNQAQRDIDFRVVWPDDSLHWLRGSAQFYPAAQTESAGRLLGTVTDVTHLKQVKVDLKESEARLRRAVEQAPFPIFIHGEDGQILQMSQAVSEISGYAASEIRTLEDWTEKAYGEQQESVLEQINRLYALDRRVDEGEFEIRAKDGETHTWLFSSAPLGQTNDGTRLVISMAADVTAQKQAEADLATRLRQQAAVAQLSQLALSGLDLLSLFDRATQMLVDSLGVEYCKVLELSPDGQSLLLRSGVGWQPGLVGQAAVDTEGGSQGGYTLLSQQPVVVEDLRTETRFSGPSLLTEHGVVSGISVVILGTGDRPFGVLGAHSRQFKAFTPDDVNFVQAVANLLATAIARKQGEQALEQMNLTLEQRVLERTQELEAANQELEAFSYSVAHDLRAPLRAIQGFAQVLEEDYDEALDDLGWDYIHRMAKSAENLDTLVQDLLTYSQLGRLDIYLQPISLDAVLNRVLAALEPTVRASRARVELTQGLPMVYAHRSIIKSVMSNLIGNALKFVTPNTLPQVQIWAEPVNSGNGATNGSQSDPQLIRIWVADNGTGIAPQHQERIFRPFERLHGVEDYPGTGIGLSIVERSVRRMGGQVGVESRLGEGSRFWIELRRVTN